MVVVVSGVFVKHTFSETECVTALMENKKDDAVANLDFTWRMIPRTSVAFSVNCMVDGSPTTYLVRQDDVFPKNRNGELEHV